MPRGRPIRFFVGGDPAPQGSKSGFPFVRRGSRCRCGSPEPRPRCRSCYGTGWQLTVTVRMAESSKRVKGWRNAVSDTALLHRRDRYPERVPLRVVAVFAFQRPQSHLGAKGLNKTGREFPGPQGKTTHGDIEKLARAVHDALTGGLYHDDADVVAIEDLKVWTTGETGAYLSVSPFAIYDAESYHTLLAAFGMDFVSDNSLTITRQGDAHSSAPVDDVPVMCGDWSQWTGDAQLDVPDPLPFR